MIKKLVVVVTLLAFSTAVFAQEDPVADAKRDAAVDTSKGLWFTIGFFCSVIGWGLSDMRPKYPPADRLVGKTDEYTDDYIVIYKSEVTKIQGEWARWGCFTSVLTGWLILCIDYNY